MATRVTFEGVNGMAVNDLINIW